MVKLTPVERMNELWELHAANASQVVSVEKILTRDREGHDKDSVCIMRNGQPSA